MKKLTKILLVLVAFFVIAACGEDELEKNVANPSNKNDMITLGDDVEAEKMERLYNNLKDEVGLEKAHDLIIEIIAEEELNLKEDEEMQAIFDNKAHKRVLDLKNEDFASWRDTFDEMLLVRNLRKQMFEISCPNGYGPTFDSETNLIDDYLLCDYSDYIERELKIEILVEMLEEQYIIDVLLEEEEDYITRRNTRYVEYLKIPRGDVSEDLEFMQNGIDLLTSGSSLKDIEQLWYDKLVEKLDEDFESIGTRDDSNFSKFADFVYNESKYNRYFTLEEGYDIKFRELYDERFLNSEIINLENEGSLSESLSDTLLDDDFLNRTYDINGENYLVSSLASGELDEGDIIINHGGDFYFITVKEIEDNKEGDFFRETLELIRKDESNVEKAIEYYLGQHLVDVHDEDLYEYLKDLYPSIFTR